MTELRLCLTMWDQYQKVIAELDEVIAAQLRLMRKQNTLPPLGPKPRLRGKKPALSQFGQTRGQIRRRLIGTMTRPFGILGVSPTDFVTASRKTLYDLALW